MAFFRFNRDNRGYEHFYLVEPIANRRGKSRPRVLYWYRTPPNIKVGRAPFDPDVQRALEAQNPNVVFDWRKIIDAPIPSADVEKWRERRRVERAEKAARRAAAGATAEAATAAASAGEQDAEEIDTADLVDIGDPDADEIERAEAGAILNASPQNVDATSDPAADARANLSAEPTPFRKRRRRRRRRGRRPDSPTSLSATPAATETATATTSSAEAALPAASSTRPPNPVEPTEE